MGVSFTSETQFDVVIDFSQNSLDVSLKERLKHRLEKEVAPIKVLAMPWIAQKGEPEDNFQVRSVHSGTVFFSRARGDQEQDLWSCIDKVALDYYRHVVLPKRQQQLSQEGDSSQSHQYKQNFAAK